MTLFRNELGAWFAVLLFSLLAGKVWGWIGDGRVEILEQQPPASPRLFHTRLAASLALGIFFDTYMLEYCVRQVLKQTKPDMTLMFGFEFAILTIGSVSTAARYMINLTEILITQKQKELKKEQIRKERQDARNAAVGGEQGRPVDAPPAAAEPVSLADVNDNDIEVDGWEEKGRWIFILDIATDFFKLAIYSSFFTILLAFYALPLHIMRDIFLTARSFFKRVSDFLKYRRATRDMNDRYPDATREDIQPEDACIICREELKPMPAQGEEGHGAISERMRPKKLPCGHILHFSCLRSWLERQQSCPTCRRPVLVDVAPAQTGHQGPNPANVGNRLFRQAADDQPRQNGDAQHLPQNHPQHQNRARVYNFGPLRIGFGAGHDEMYPDLVRQLQGGPPGQNPPPQAPRNANRQQQYSFALGFGRPRAPAAAPASSTGNVQERLQQVEQQLTQELNNLQVAASELQVVRALQNELTRLRSLQTATQTQQPHVRIDGVQSQPPANPLVQAARDGRMLMNDRHGSVLHAGDASLPAGVMLPEGWTMMPLRRVPGQPQPPPTGVPGISTPIANIPDMPNVQYAHHTRHTQAPPHAQQQQPPSYPIITAPLPQQPSQSTARVDHEPDSVAHMFSNMPPTAQPSTLRPSSSQSPPTTEPPSTMQPSPSLRNNPTTESTDGYPSASTAVDGLDDDRVPDWRPVPYRRASPPPQPPPPVPRNESSSGLHDEQQNSKTATVEDLIEDVDQ